ncbi:cell division protein [Neisseria sicca]|uniref:cell division protein n=1 Tax=Neisseria sicca TaxID=490 RepID=UPI00360D6C48
MKWLFAALVALNIIVFGGMITHRLNNAKSPNAAPVEGGAHELAQPESLRPQQAPAPADNAQPDWLQTDETQADLPEPESEEAIAERKKKEEEEQARREKEKKEREEKARREKENAAAENTNPNAAANENPAAKNASAARQCMSNASVTLDEDDYHRIKGLLTRWPHAASRTVEKRGASKDHVAKTFRVVLPADSEAMNRLEALGNKGFNGTLYNGEISLGVMKSRSSAQVLISRLSAAGFGGARIVEQDDKGNAADSTLSVSRMTVIFMSVDEKDAQEIRNIVGRYGSLNMKTCK